MRTLTAVFFGFLLAFSLPLGAADKSSSKKAPAKSSKSKSSKTTKAAKAKKPSRPPAQQHPTSERYLEIQQALVDRGYLPAATGNWGSESVTALKKFQQDQGLPTDGKLGALSLTALGLGPRRNGTVDEAIAAGMLPGGSGPTPLD